MAKILDIIEHPESIFSDDLEGMGISRDRVEGLTKRNHVDVSVYTGYMGVDDEKEVSVTLYCIDIITENNDFVLSYQNKEHRDEDYDLLYEGLIEENTDSKDTNRLVAIGFISQFDCYLNMSKEEALELDKEKEPYHWTDDGELKDGMEVKEIEFEKHFRVYDLEYF